MKLRRLSVLLSLAIALPAAHAAQFSAAELEAARALQARILTLDSHLDTPSNFERPDFDITRDYSGNGISQVDLPRGVRSGLSEALEILDGVSGIGFVHMNRKDIVRHRLVSRIVDAYDKRKSENGELTT